MLFNKKLKWEVLNNCSFVFNSLGIIISSRHMKYFKPNFHDTVKQYRVTLLKEICRLKRKKVLNFKI